VIGLAVVLLLYPSGVLAAEPSIPRIAVETARGNVRAEDVSDVAGSPPVFPVSIRIPIDFADAAARRETDASVAACEAHGLSLWMTTPIPSDERNAEAWRSAFRQWVRAHRAHLSIVELRLPDAPSAVVGFFVRAVATDLRVEAPGARLAIGGPAVETGQLSTLLTRDLAAYVDLLALSPAADVSSLLDSVAAFAPALRAVVTGLDLPSDVESAAAIYASATLNALGTRVVAVCARGDSSALKAAVRAVRPAAALVTGSVDVLDPASAVVRIEGHAEDAASVARRVLFENGSFGTYLFYVAPESPAPLEVSLTVPIEGTPVVTDLIRATGRRAAGYRRDGSTVHVQVPQTGRPMLIDFNADATGEALAARAAVSAIRNLTVEEIIARHRQQMAAQDIVLQHYSAGVRMEQHFRPTVTDPGYDVVSENRYFSAADGVEWEELTFAVNGSRFGSKNRPPFPLLQPEKVLSLPLQLRFSDDYRYQLVGAERVDRFDCYVIKFDPLDGQRSLYRGTVWIDRESFARVKVSAVQTHLGAPVVSNQEDQRYSAVATIDGHPVFVLTTLTARQLIMIAGRNLLVERSVAFTDFKINDPQFAATRLEARRSEHVMYRDTDNGLRYFVKSGDTRIVSDRPTNRAKAAAIGVTIDPSFAFPLPIFGINYLNFAFRNPQTQLAMLFGGVLAAINIQRPKLPHTPFDASIDFFGIAVPSSDRLYDISGEHPAERVITWPLTTGLNLGWQFTPFQKITYQYQFRFDGYHKDTTTSDAFLVPSSTTTNGLGGAYEYKRAGFSWVANGAWFRRTAWKAWGLPDSPSAAAAEAPGRSYVKYSGNLSRDFYIGPFQKLHFNGAFFGGQDLDRFNRYQFGLFDDTRIHGVPASGVRFDELAMGRATYTFDLLQTYRLDVFLDRAWGRDRSATRDWQPLTGVGVAVNLLGPRTTIIRADIGHAFLPAGYRGVGSTVVQILILKPLGS
jgi:hypothetical protein